MNLIIDYSLVGTGTGGELADTSEMHVMRYGEAIPMADDKEVNSSMMQ